MAAWTGPSVSCGPRVQMGEQLHAPGWRRAYKHTVVAGPLPPAHTPTGGLAYKRQQRLPCQSDQRLANSRTQATAASPLPMGGDGPVRDIPSASAPPGRQRGCHTTSAWSPSPSPPSQPTSCPSYLAALRAARTPSNVEDLDTKSVCGVCVCGKGGEGGSKHPSLAQLCGRAPNEQPAYSSPTGTAVSMPAASARA